MARVCGMSRMRAHITRSEPGTVSPLSSTMLNQLSTSLGIEIGAFGRQSGVSRGPGTSGIVANCAFRGPSRASPVAPMAARTIRSPTMPVIRSCEVRRPDASTSIRQSKRSPMSALPTNCTVAQSAARPVSASMIAVETAMPVPP